MRLEQHGENHDQLANQEQFGAPVSGRHDFLSDILATTPAEIGLRVHGSCRTRSPPTMSADLTQLECQDRTLHILPEKGENSGVLLKNAKSRLFRAQGSRRNEPEFDTKLSRNRDAVLSVHSHQPEEPRPDRGIQR